MIHAHQPGAQPVPVKRQEPNPVYVPTRRRPAPEERKQPKVPEKV